MSETNEFITFEADRAFIDALVSNSHTYKTNLRMIEATISDIFKSIDNVYDDDYIFDLSDNLKSFDKAYFVWYVTYDGKRNDDSIEINKVMAISVFKHFHGLKMIGMALNRFPYYAKGSQKRIEVKEKAKAAVREHIRFIATLGWAELSDEAEKILEKSLPWAKYDIAPEVLMNNSVFQGLSMDLDGMHYYRTLHRNQATVRIGAYGTLQDRKDILHISDVIYGHPSLCIVDDLRDYNRACFEGDELSDYNYYSDSKLLALDDYDIHGIINIEALVRIAQLDSSRLTEEQLRAAENKLKDKVIIDSSDVNFILDIIKSSKRAACIPSKDSFYWDKDYSIENIIAALHDLTEADYVANPDDNMQKYIGDIVLTFKPKRQLNICNITKISNPTIQIKVDTDRRYYHTLVLITIKDSDNQVIV